MVEIRLLAEDDRPEWDALARRYYAEAGVEVDDDSYERAWPRLLARDEIRGIAARADGRMVGFAHYLFHPSIWKAGRCYLADLFVDEQVRGQGAARLLIDAIAERARQRGCQRYYWLTQQHNVRARGLYDQVARFAGFIRYDYPLNVPT